MNRAEYLALLDRVIAAEERASQTQACRCGLLFEDRPQQDRSRRIFDDGATCRIVCRDCAAASDAAGRHIVVPR